MTRSASRDGARAAAPRAGTRKAARKPPVAASGDAAPSSIVLKLAPLDNHALANLCGPLEANLRQIEAALDVTVRRRAGEFTLQGAPDAVAQARVTMERLYDEAHAHELSVDDVQLGLVETLRGAAVRAHGDDDDAPAGAPGAGTLRTRRADLHGRTPNQVAYLEAIAAHDITFGIGPAGTGKTYLAVACAVDALERGAVKRLVLVRPAVEAGERLGFLPGDLAQKVDPYLRPLYDALYDLMGYDKVARLFERQTIEIAPLAYMRGRTLNHSFIILDEAQNTTPEQMKMFLTRMGFGSKAVVTGDVTQIDLARHQKSGLVEADRVLHDVRGIAFVRFDSSDVVRHPLVQKIVDAYDRAKPAP